MEPLTAISYLITSFVGFYIGAGIYNSYMSTRRHQAMMNYLGTITTSLDRTEAKIK